MRIDLSSARKHVHDLEQTIETNAACKQAEQHLAEAQAQFEMERHRVESEKADLDSDSTRLRASLNCSEAERDRLEHLRQRLEGEKAVLGTELTGLQEQIDAERRHSAVLRRELTGLKEQIDAERRHSEDEKTAVAAEYANLEQRLEDLAEELTRLLTSKSWRVTKPLRALVRLELLPLRLDHMHHSLRRRDSSGTRFA